MHAPVCVYRGKPYLAVYPTETAVRAAECLDSKKHVTQFIKAGKQRQLLHTLPVQVASVEDLHAWAVMKDPFTKV